METRFNRSDSCTILVVDDDPAMRSLLADELSENGCEVVECIDGNDALFRVKTFIPNVIITDLKMTGGGFAYLQGLATAVQNCPIILLTAFGNSQTKMKAKECGIAAYFDKPVRVSDLKEALYQVCPMGKPQTCQNTETRNNQ